MTRLLGLLLGFFMTTPAVWSQPPTCDSLTCSGDFFAQIIQSPSGYDLKGSCLLPLEDGHFYLAGTVDTAIYLALHDPSGRSIWEKALPTPSENAQTFSLNQLYQDREGYLVGIGSTFNSPTVQKGFIFRFDPLRDRLFYFHIYSQNSELTNLIELPEQGQYLLFGSRLGEAGPFFESLLIEKIDKDSGLPVQAGKRYDLGGREQISHVLRHGDKVFVTGIYTLLGGGAGNSRAVIACFDLDGNHEFSFTGFQDGSANSRLFGFDISIVGTTLYLLQWGSIGVVAGGINTQMMLSAFNLQGGLQWTKIYDITNFLGESGIEMQVTPGGLLLYGNDLGSSRDLFLLHLNLQGEPLWATAYDSPGASLLYWRSNQQLHVFPDAILFAATYINTQSGNGILLVRSPMDGLLDSDCLLTYPLDVNFTENNDPWTPQEPSPLPPDGQWQAYNSVLYYLQNQHESSCLIPCCPPCAYLQSGLPHTQTGTSAGAVICQGEQYFFGGESYSSSGTYTATNACGGTDTLTLEVLPSPPSPTLNHQICEGDSLLIAGFYRTIAGNYPEILPTANGCDSVVIHQLSVLPSPQIRSQQQLDCSQQITHLELGVSGGLSPYTYTWQDSPDTSSSRQLPPGQYQVRVEGSNACATQLPFHIPNEALPDIQLAPQYFAPLGEEVLIDPNFTGSLPAATQILWLAPNGDTLCRQCPQLRFRPSQGGRYTLRLLSPSGCQETSSFELQLASQPRIFLPTAFSPNRDGINDYYYPASGPEVVQILELKIYDRWGGLLFQQSNSPPNQAHYGWDGQAQAQAANTGLYLASLRYQLLDGSEATAVQHFILLW